MRVPEEVRQSLTLLSPFQVLAELLCCSSAWSSPSEISSGQCPSFRFFASLWYVCISPFLCRHIFLTSAEDLPCFQAFLHLQQNPPFYTCNSPATPASAWERGTEGCWWAVTHQLRDIPNPAAPLLLPECRWENASWLLQDKGWTLGEAQGSKRSDFQDPTCSSSHMSNAFGGMFTVFSNFLGHIYTAAKSSELVQITYLAELESQVISFLKKISYWNILCHIPPIL